NVSQGVRPRVRRRPRRAGRSLRGAGPPGGVGVSKFTVVAAGPPPFYCSMEKTPSAVAAWRMVGVWGFTTRALTCRFLRPALRAYHVAPPSVLLKTPPPREFPQEL